MSARVWVCRVKDLGCDGIGLRFLGFNQFGLKGLWVKWVFGYGRTIGISAYFRRSRFGILGSRRVLGFSNV